jgi:hypothetical protein
VVTALQGTARLTRPTIPTPVDLRFRDGLAVRDVVNTAEKSLVRILFGGKSTVTVRELSRLEVREEALPGGATLSVHELSAGAILVNVARQLLRPGDEVQIRTPNAVAAVRGTTLSADCNTILHRCTFAVLAGNALVTPFGGSAVALRPNTVVAVTGTPATGVQTDPLQTLTPAQATQVMQQYAVKPPIQAAANQQQTGEAQLRTATQLVSAVTGTPMPPSSSASIAPSTADPTTSVVAAPVAADVSEVVEGDTSDDPDVPPPEPPPGPPELPPVVPPMKFILSGVNTTPTPVFPLTGSFTLSAPDSLFEVPVDGNATIAGPLLDAIGATMMLGSHALLIDGALTSLSMNPLFRFEASTSTIGGSLVVVGPQGAFNASGPLLEVTSSILTTSGGPLIVVEAGGTFAVTSLGTSPLLSLQAGILSTSGSLLDLRESAVALVGPVVKLGQRSLLTNARGPVLRIDGGFLSADAILTTDGIGNQMFLAGSLMDLSHATVTLRKVFDIPVGNSDILVQTLTPGEPSIRLQGSTLTLTEAGAELLRFGMAAEGSPSQTGVGLVANDSTLNLNGPLFALGGVHLLDGTPQLQLSRTVIDQRGGDSLIEVSTAPVTMVGGLLEAHDSTLTAASSLLRVADTSLTQSGDALPFMRFDQSMVQAADFFTELSGSMSLTAPLARLTSSLVTAGADFLYVGRESTFTSTASEPLIQLVDSALNAFTLLFNDGGQINLLGAPLLHAVNSQLTFDFAVVESEFGGQLASASHAPLVALDGGRLTSRGHLFLASGSGSGLYPTLGKPLQSVGSLLEARNGANIDAAGNALHLDAALLEATQPIFNLIGSMTQTTALSTGASTMDLLKSSLISTGPVVALNRGLINVHSGPLISLADGSTLVVTGDLLQLLNGSRINVFNGPLIRVGGSGSALSVSGALVLFGGSGGNAIVVNNSIAPTAILSGVPVSATSGGLVSIGPNPVQNPALGTISVSPGGSLIQATNGGTVNIAAP